MRWHLLWSEMQNHCSITELIPVFCRQLCINIILLSRYTIMTIAYRVEISDHSRWKFCYTRYDHDSYLHNKHQHSINQLPLPHAHSKYAIDLLYITYVLPLCHMLSISDTGAACYLLIMHVYIVSIKDTTCQSILCCPPDHQLDSWWRFHHSITSSIS